MTLRHLNSLEAYYQYGR